MGFFDKIKNFGSKIVKGIRKGVDFVRDKVAPIVNKIAPFVKTGGTIAAAALGHPEMIPNIHKVVNIADNIAHGLRRPQPPPIE